MKTPKVSLPSPACAVFVLIASLGAGPLRAADADGFVPLFNGRDLTGWVRVNGAEDTFTVRDGMIIDSGLPIGVMRTARMYENFIGGWKINDAILAAWMVNGSHFTSKGGMKGGRLNLWSERSYRDFVLCVDWRLVKKPQPKALPTFTPDGLYVRDAQGQIVRKEIPDAGDSGIFLRGSPNHQVNIWSQPMGSGDIQEIHKDEKIPAELRRAMLPKMRADAPFGKWNRFFITLEGGRVTVVLNDQTVIDHALLPSLPPEGPIALQYHGGAVEFTNIFIREL